MSALKSVMNVVSSHEICNRFLESDCNDFGGLISTTEYAWFVSGANIILYSKQLGSVISSRSFPDNQRDKSFKITYVKELKNNEETCNFLLVGVSFKSSGILFVCQLPTLITVRCIEIPNPVSYISTILNDSLGENQLCEEFEIMSTVLLIGTSIGAVYAIDLRQNYIEKRLRKNDIFINELKPNKLFLIRKNKDIQELKEMNDCSDLHLAFFLNENFHAFCKKQYKNKLNLNVSSLLYINEINTIAIGYSTGHLQLWDCKMMQTIYLLKEPKCVMPITHIEFLEPSDDPNNLCYLWIIQSNNCRLPNATMIALTYKDRSVMPNGSSLYKVYQGNGIKLEMSLKRESGFGRCVSTLSLCNVNSLKIDIDEDCEIRLFAMLIEICKDVDADKESYVFLFDINQWYKAQMPSIISHFQISNSYASFVKLPYNVSFLDFNIIKKSLRPFGCNFRDNVEELYYPSSIYFECDCLVDTKIIRFKHSGVQQEILDQLFSKGWRSLINPNLVFNQCLQTNLKPFFWDKSEDYINYTLSDQRSFIISILVEYKMLSVLHTCIDKWKTGIYVSTEATIMNLAHCLWRHVMNIKQYADKLCIPLFDFSGTQLDRKSYRILRHCLSQMQCVKYFLQDLHNAYGLHIINVDYSYRVYTLNLVTEYFKAVICFLNYGLLPESHENSPGQYNIKCDFNLLIQYANKRRMEFGDSQLYLIDVLIKNEPKGNKLIEQWLHEGDNQTKGFYPPANIQCLLRIFLNSALSEEVKNFITLYFLIDVCSTHKIDSKIANRMCNFTFEFGVENKGLNTLCRFCWLMDHDMFEDAIDILSHGKNWVIRNKKLNWLHWSVLKLLVFKAEYFWAQYFLKLIDVNLENIDDYKFYINIHIMNNQCYEALKHICSTQFEEKQILLDYFFDRCKETNKLKCLLENALNIQEENLFFSYLKRHNDTESITCHLLFLLQRGRYLEAGELNTSLKNIPKLKFNDTLTITSLLVKRYEKNIPTILKQKYDRHPIKCVYRNTDIAMKCMNSDANKFVMHTERQNTILRKRNLSDMSSNHNSFNFLLPMINYTPERSAEEDIICNEKRRKVNDSLDKVYEEIIKPIGNNVLDILNTPLVEKTVSSPLASNISSILKPGSAVKDKRALSKIDDEISVPKIVLRFSLPDNNSIEQLVPAENTNMSKADIQKLNRCYNVQNYKYEEMDVSEECSYSEQNMVFNHKIDENSSTQIITLLSDDEVEEQNHKPVLTLLHKNNNSNLNEDNYNIEPLSQHKVIKTQLPMPISLNTNENVDHHSVPMVVNIFNSSPNNQDDSNNSDEFLQEIKSSNSNTYSQDSDQVIKCLSSNDNDDNDDYDYDDDGDDDDDDDDNDDDNDNDDLIIVDSGDEVENVQSDMPSSSSTSLDDGDVFKDSSNDSDLENTRYGRFKSTKKNNFENSESEENVEECTQYSSENEKNNLDVYNISDQDESNFQQQDIKYYDETEEGNLKQYDTGIIETNEEIYVPEEKNETEEDNLKPFDIESNQTYEEMYVPEEKDETEGDNLKSYYAKCNQTYEVMYVPDEKDETEGDNLKPYDVESNQTYEVMYVPDEKDETEGGNLKLYDVESNQTYEVMYVPDEKDKTEGDNLKLYDVESNQTYEVMYVPDEKDETEGDNLKQYNTGIIETNEEIYVPEEKDEIEGDNLKPYDIESNQTNEEMDIAEKKDKTEGDNLKPYDLEIIKTNEEMYVPEEKDETEGDNLKPYDIESKQTNEMDIPEEKDKTEGDNLKPYDIESNQTDEKMYVLEKEDNIIYSNVLESNTNKLTSCSFDFTAESSFIDNDYNIPVDQQIDDSTTKTQMTNEIFNPNETSSQILGDDLNQSPVTVSSQLGTFGVNAIQSTKFLFGESFFGEQLPKSQPMLLFGQVYSFENEPFVVDSNNDKPETQALNSNDREEVFTNKKIGDDVELVDDIQDILELGSLPESEIDDNVQKPSQSNSIEQKIKETNSLLDYQSSFPLDHSHLSTTIVSGNTDSPDLKVETRSILMSPLKELCNTDDISQNVEINQIDIINPIETKSEKLSCNVAIDKECNEVSLISQSTDNVQTSLQSSSAVNIKIKPQKSFNRSVITRSKHAKSVSVCSNIDDLDQFLDDRKTNNTLDSFSHLKLVKDPVLHSKSMSLSPTNISKKNDLYVLKDISDLKNERTQCIQKVDTCVLYVNKDKNADESHKLIANDSVELINLQENIQKVSCINQHVSLRENVTISKVNNSGSNDNTQLPNTKKFEEVVQSTSKPPYINKQMNEDIMKKSGAKSIPFPDTNVIKTRSRTRSESNLVELDTSINIFRSSVIDVNSGQKRVLLSRKRSISQQNLIPTRRSGRSKSLAPLEEEISINRRAVFGLEKISEENVSQSENNFQVKNSEITRKSKFNFGSKKSKSIEPSSLVNEPCDTRIIKTPKRSKSIQSDPVLTYSMVKTKPKQSASVDLLHLKNQSSTEIDDFMDVLTKPLKMRKRSSSESTKNKKKSKIFKNVNEAAQSDSLESDQMSNKQLSPISGGNMKHMLLTPVRKHLKHISPDQSVCSEDSFIDSDSNHVMTRSMNQSNKSLVSKRGVRNCKMCNTKTMVQDNINELHQSPSTSRPITRLQQTKLEKSLLSIGQEDNNTSVSVPKPEIQKLSKKAKQKNVNK